MASFPPLLDTATAASAADVTVVVAAGAGFVLVVLLGAAVPSPASFPNKAAEAIVDRSEQRPAPTRNLRNLSKLSSSSNSLRSRCLSSGSRGPVLRRRRPPQERQAGRRWPPPIPSTSWRFRA